MTQLVWDELAARRSSAGVSRGVLYPPTGPGVVWNGLVSVEETAQGADKNEYHYDGVKYHDETTNPDFQAKLQAYSHPREFKPCLGEQELVPGFTVTRQPREPFELCYRTELEPVGYRLHLLYNVMATPQGRSYKSAGASVEPSMVDVLLSAAPMDSTTIRPTGHFMIDSVHISSDKMDEIEWLLYGTEFGSPFLPLPQVFIDIINS
jgi:hypothetical protein